MCLLCVPQPLSLLRAWGEVDLIINLCSFLFWWSNFSDNRIDFAALIAETEKTSVTEVSAASRRTLQPPCL